MLFLAETLMDLNVEEGERPILLGRVMCALLTSRQEKMHSQCIDLTQVFNLKAADISQKQCINCS